MKKYNPRLQPPKGNTCYDIHLVGWFEAMRGEPIMKKYNPRLQPPKGNTCYDIHLVAWFVANRVEPFMRKFVFEFMRIYFHEKYPSPNS